MPAETDDADLYMAAKLPDDPEIQKKRKAHVISRHSTIRDLYMYRKLQKEEFESYRDKDYKEEAIEKLQKEFRDNYIERLTVVGELKALGIDVVDPLVPADREGASDKVDEADVVAYMENESHPSELATTEDRKEYYKKRYATIGEAYRYLKLQQEEAEQYQDKRYREIVIGKLKKLYRNNHQERLAVVTALRIMGEKIQDPFVPLSKI